MTPTQEESREALRVANKELQILNDRLVLLNGEMLRKIIVLEDLLCDATDGILGVRDVVFGGAKK